MLGAHFDSWHAGTGATDNAAGSAVMMEAMRILKQSGLPLRRTVRIGLWGGEEQGLIGSRQYVTETFADRATMAVKPAHAKFSGYFNVDNGTGAIRGVYLQGNEARRADLRRVDEAVQQPRHEHADDSRHRRHRPPGVRRRRPPRLPVHPGSGGVQHAHAPLEHGPVRAGPGRGHAEERGDRRRRSCTTPRTATRCCRASRCRSRSPPAAAAARAAGRGQ